MLTSVLGWSELLTCTCSTGESCEHPKVEPGRTLSVHSAGRGILLGTPGLGALQVSSGFWVFFVFHLVGCGESSSAPGLLWGRAVPCAWHRVILLCLCPVGAYKQAYKHCHTNTSCPQGVGWTVCTLNGAELMLCPLLCCPALH